MQDVYKDVLLSLALAGVGAFGFFYIQYGPGEALQVSQDAEITFRSFPSAISILLLVLSCLYGGASILAAARARSQAPSPVEGIEIEEATSVPGPKHLLIRVVAILGLLIGFALTIGLAPLFVLASIFLFIAFIIFGQTSWGRMAIVALVGGALFHGLFVVILHLPFG